MATITYSSFPRFGDESSSPTIHPPEQLSPTDAAIPIDSNLVDISDLAAEDEDRVLGLNPLDCAKYHLAPSTPTKERTRRATMPDSMKLGVQGVPPNSPLCVQSLGHQVC